MKSTNESKILQGITRESLENQQENHESSVQTALLVVSFKGTGKDNEVLPEQLTSWTNMLARSEYEAENPTTAKSILSVFFWRREALLWKPS